MEARLAVVTGNAHKDSPLSKDVSGWLKGAIKIFEYNIPRIEVAPICLHDGRVLTFGRDGDIPTFYMGDELFLDAAVSAHFRTAMVSTDSIDLAAVEWRPL